MTTRLVPNSSDAAEFELTLGGWSALLLAGPGLVIGFGHSITPGLIWESDYENTDLSPQTNDGYPFSGEQARAMALVAKGVVSIWEGGTGVFEAAGGSKERFGDHQPPAHARIQDMERFAEWAATSGGFKVH